MTLEEIRLAGKVTRLRDGAVFLFHGPGTTRQGKPGAMLSYPGPRHRSHQQVPGGKPKVFSLDELSETFGLGELPLPEGLS